MISEKIIAFLKDEIAEYGNVAEYYIKSGKLSVITKEDGSPVSNGDIDVSNRLINSLRKVSTSQVISEEDKKHELDNAVFSFWLVDPIDGTYKYIQGDPNYTINVGLVEKGEPVCGFIYKPSEKIMYYLDANSNLVIEENCVPVDRVIRKSSDKITSMLPDKQDWRERSQKFLSSHNVNDFNCYSGSSKLAQIAHGYADIYPKLDICMEWDVAAGHALLKSIGGDILDANHNSLVYGKKNFVVPHFVAFNNRWLSYRELVLFNNKKLEKSIINA